jgi:hypothetical protein
MTDELFDQAVSQSLRIATASSGADLSGFRLDLTYALEQRARFSAISVINTGDQRCMLRVTCSAQASTAVAAVLAQIWEEDLRYAAFADHRIRHAGAITELEFVTYSDGPDPLYVTGQIRVAQPGDGQAG